MDLNKLAREVHEANQKWWHDLETGKRLDRNESELCMLIISELSEALEGERKNLQDDKLPHRKMAEVEMADVVIRTLDLAAGFGIYIKELEPVALEGLDSIPPPENRGEFLFNIAAAVTDHEMQPPVRIAFIIWMAEKYCKTFGYDLWGAYQEKMEYNKTRHDHTIEARKQANGKKF